MDDGKIVNQCQPRTGIRPKKATWRIHFPAIKLGNSVVAVPPDRDTAAGSEIQAGVACNKQL